ncbi:flagellar basal-body rod protein FlgG [Sphingobacteriales bacterium CHB3]|nr:flagellar basal-body rod protein FlgG [Sphingobacteriales bacterium CHB3]
MNRALRTASAGMGAQQLNVDTIAHNLANVNTTGFKKSRAEFQDLMYQTIKASGGASGNALRETNEIQVGTGTAPMATQKSFVQGDLQATSNPFDISIVGEGFFQIRKPDGTIAYTRDGSFKLSSDGTLVTSLGYVLEPGVSLSSDAQSFSVSRDGTVEVSDGSGDTPVRVAQLELAKFVNVAGLKAIGNNLFAETPASGAPMVGTAGTEGFGELQQGYLESSNVDVVEEMVNMIVAQRAYEINSKTVKTVEDMLQIANNLKR